MLARRARQVTRHASGPRLCPGRDPGRRSWVRPRL